jgi:hypothetical protein
MRWLALVLVFLATPAFADDQVQATSSSHQGQFGLSARIGLGARGIATYNSDYCGTLDGSAANGNAPVCSGRAPFFLELEAAYGAGRTLDLVLGLHVGLESSFGPTAATAGPHELRLEPGVRFFFSETGRSKLFVQPSLVFDFSGYNKPSGQSYGTDFGVRALEGYWLDLHRSFGIYAFVGESAELARWLSFELDFGLGIQGRYP